MEWHNLSLAGQIGNIGSEISRARYWAERENPVQREKSLERALDLIDGTLACGMSFARRREVARLRELISDFLAGSGIYEVTPLLLEEYCLPFAILARRNPQRG